MPVNPNSTADTPGPLGVHNTNYDLRPTNVGPIGVRTTATTNLQNDGQQGLSLKNPRTYKPQKLSEAGVVLLKTVERLSLTPYDDQTGNVTARWVQGATIGYGHLIKSTEWNGFSAGISLERADQLFLTDLSPFVDAVFSNISVNLFQHEFDALVIFAFNIGRGGFANSTVVKVINDKFNFVLDISKLELAWKSWNKSQGKVMKGLDNRRNCEWKIFTKNIYERW